MKLIDTGLSNTKIKKTQQHSNPFDRPFRLSSLSLYPNDTICAGSILAQCREACLRHAGRGTFGNVIEGRQKKTDLFMTDRDRFLDTYTRELENFQKLCDKDNIQAVHRGNVISDISWEKYGIPQLFPRMFFYDYTKIAHRLGRTPKNYQLMFSYSGVPEYQNQVRRALKTNVPISAVFNGPFPDTCRLSSLSVLVRSAFRRWSGLLPTGVTRLFVLIVPSSLLAFFLSFWGRSCLSVLALFPCLFTLV